MFQSLLLTDTAGKKSATLTAFVIGFVIVNAKLILSGVAIGDLTLAEFDGADYAAAIAALGAVYVMRRSTAPKVEEKQQGGGE